MIRYIFNEEFYKSHYLTIKYYLKLKASLAQIIQELSSKTGRNYEKKKSLKGKTNSPFPSASKPRELPRKGGDCKITVKFFG